MSSYKLIEAERTNFPVPAYVQDARSLKEWLLRVEGENALQEKPGRCRSHREDQGDPRAQPANLRLSEGACGVEESGRSLLEEARGEAHERSRASGPHARWEKGNHSSRPESGARRGPCE